jgi:hypothetical protein
MRNLAIDQAHARARVRAWSWCSVLTIALAILPVPASAQPPEPAPNDPEAFEPVEIIPAPPPEREPVAEPEPEPEPVAELEPPVEDPSALAESTSPAQLAKVQTMRRASLGLIATGGVVASVGLGVTIAFSVLGHQAQNREAPVIEDIERNDSMARVGGVLLASGIAVVAIGGILFASAKRKAMSQATAQVRVAPSIGGLVVSGRF